MAHRTNFNPRRLKFPNGPFNPLSPLRCRLNLPGWRGPSQKLSQPRLGSDKRPAHWRRRPSIPLLIHRKIVAMRRGFPLRRLGSQGSSGTSARRINFWHSCVFMHRFGDHVLDLALRHYLKVTRRILGREVADLWQKIVDNPRKIR